MNKIDEYRAVISTYKALVRVAKTLHTLDEKSCNGYADTDWGRKAEVRDNTRTKNLLKKAQELASYLGMYAYHQGDPRGCSLYLVENLDASTNYTNGIAIY